MALKLPLRAFFVHTNIRYRQQEQPTWQTAEATFAEPNQYSRGIVHVLVNGTRVVSDEQLLEDTFPGRPLSTHTP
jgi:hypothetical protein